MRAKQKRAHIGDRYYYRVWGFIIKSEATKVAAKVRNLGYSVRVIKGRIGYGIYTSPRYRHPMTVVLGKP